MAGPVIDRSSEAATVGTVPASWDTIWAISNPIESPFAGYGDWAMADPALDPRQAGGLAATDPYAEAILIQLGTHRRRGTGVAGDAGDLRGWWGDSVAIDPAAGEGELGCWLWTLRRAAITDDLLKMAKLFVLDALETLKRQGAATHIECLAEGDRANGFLYLSVQVYIPGRDLPYDLDLPPYPLWA